jgi:uncharacterized protein
MIVVQIALYVVIAVLTAVTVRARVQRRITLGLGPRTGAAGDAGIGVAITGVAMLLVFAAGLLVGVVRVERVGFDVLVLVLALVIYLVLAALEELLYRVLAVNGLVVLTGNRWIAVAGAAALFGVGHAFNTGATALSVVSATLGGVMYGLAFVLSGRVWMPLGMHLAWNYVQGTVLGYPVSGTALAGAAVVHQAPADGPVWLTGGAYGPEGGVLGIAARLLVIAAVLVLAPRRRVIGTLDAPPVAR